MNNKEKFLAQVSKESTSTLEKNKGRIKNREALRESQQIAIKVLKRLDDLNWTQKDLAKVLEVSPQQVNKIVSGKENLTIETQIKLQSILNVPILASYYESKFKASEDVVLRVEKKVEQISNLSDTISDYNQNTKKIKMQYFST